MPDNELSYASYLFGMACGILNTFLMTFYTVGALYYPVPVKPFNVYVMGGSRSYYSEPLYLSHVEPWFLILYVILCVWTITAMFTATVFRKNSRYWLVIAFVFIHCLWHYYATYGWVYVTNFGMALIGLVYGAIYIRSER